MVRGYGQCTAPVLGHVRGGGADCPVHGGSRGYQYAAPPRPAYVPPAPTPPAYRSVSASGTSRRPRWSPPSSTVSYTSQQVRDLEPVRRAVIARTQAHDVFLCHAWPDRRADAQDLYDLLVDEDVTVWFSEVTLRPGTDMRVAIDRGLVSSRMGIVLVTPAMLEKLSTDRSVASNELSALLRRNLLVPVMHGVSFEELDQVSPTLASRGGFSTVEDSIEDIAVKIAELVSELHDEEADELSMNGVDR
ncbi:TIR domain-containing protein [Microbacterium sp. CBS5P-1]|nr:toll/interleukin-1 receptor domain-containing protein [Microbacterium excoecariae]NHI16260.1 TIR domain-containing protein [Microbacterium excoecariae]